MRLQKAIWSLEDRGHDQDYQNTVRVIQSISLPYDPDHVAKIKAIKGSQWHPAEKHWAVPFSERTLKKVISVFESQGISLAPCLNISHTTHETSRFQDLKKEFDAVKFQRKVGQELGKKYTSNHEAFLRELKEKYGNLQKQKLGTHISQQNVSGFEPSALRPSPAYKHIELSI